MDNSFFHSLISWLHLHPEWGYFFALLFSFLEGVALVGFIIPGSVVMTIAGILAGSGILPLTNLILWSALGAFLGDYLSYGIGYYFSDDVEKVWPFQRYPKLIARGETFFQKHGGKSIFIGRFIGPIRPVIPLVAGSLRFSHLRFIAVDSVASLLWPLAYMLPGFIIGAASLALPPEASTRIIISLIIFLIIICILYWLLKLFLKQMIALVDKKVYQFWQFLKRHPRCQWLYHLLKNTHIPDDHRQLGRALLALMSALLFIFVLLCTITQSWLFDINAPIHELARSLYNPHVKLFFLNLSYFCNPKNLLVCWLVILGWFSLKRQWYAAIHWGLVGAFAAGSVFILKPLIALPRPQDYLIPLKSFSFPSGHSTMTTAFFSFLAFIVCQERHRYFAYIAYSLAALLIFLVCLARVYIGAHWPTDVIGGIFLGLAICFSVALSYGKVHQKLAGIGTLLSIALVTLVILWGHSFIRFFAIDKQQFKPIWPKQTITVHDWWNQNTHRLPIYRKDRLGHPIQILNIEWLSNPNTVVKKLTSLGWQQKQPSLLLHTINYFGSKNREKVLPLFSEVYQGQKPVVIMTKLSKENKKLLILRLWQSRIYIKTKDPAGLSPLLVGAISYRKKTHSWFFEESHKKTNPQIISPTKAFKVLLSKNKDIFIWKALNFPNIQGLGSIEDNGWQQVIFLIKNNEQ